MMQADHRLVVETNFGASNAFAMVDRDFELVGLFMPRKSLCRLQAVDGRVHPGDVCAERQRAWHRRSRASRSGYSCAPQLLHSPPPLLHQPR